MGGRLLVSTLFLLVLLTSLLGRRTNDWAVNAWGLVTNLLSPIRQDQEPTTRASLHIRCSSQWATKLTRCRLQVNRPLAQASTDRTTKLFSQPNCLRLAQASEAICTPLTRRWVRGATTCLRCSSVLHTVSAKAIENRVTTQLNSQVHASTRLSLGLTGNKPKLWLLRTQCSTKMQKYPDLAVTRQRLLLA